MMRLILKYYIFPYQKRGLWRNIFLSVNILYISGVIVSCVAAHSCADTVKEVISSCTLTVLTLKLKKLKFLTLRVNTLALKVI